MKSHAKIRCEYKKICRKSIIRRTENKIRQISINEEK